MGNTFWPLVSILSVNIFWLTKVSQSFVSDVRIFDTTLQIKEKGDKWSTHQKSFNELDRHKDKGKYGLFLF